MLLTDILPRLKKIYNSRYPGHIQYTRNMVTGASTANLALISGCSGVVEQTIERFIADL